MHTAWRHKKTHTHRRHKRRDARRTALRIVVRHVAGAVPHRFRELAARRASDASTGDETARKEGDHRAAQGHQAHGTGALGSHHGGIGRVTYASPEDLSKGKKVVAFFVSFPDVPKVCLQTDIFWRGKRESITANIT